MAKKRRRDRGGSDSLVSRRTALGLLLTGGAVAAGVEGTSAFSSVTGDRSFSVGTADDANALLGIDANDPTGDAGSSVALFTLTNRFSDSITVDQVSVVSSGSLGIDRSDLAVSQWTLSPGQTTDITAALSCSSEVTDDVTLQIRVLTAADQASVELARTTTVSCETSGGACLTDAEIELEGERIPCIDIAVRGRDTDVSIDLSNVVVTGSVRVDVRGGGGSEIEIDIEDTTIRGDLVVNVRGAGGAELDIELDGNAIDGDVDVPGYDGDDAGSGSGADIDDEEEEDEEEEEEEDEEED